ncbi:hypothetical protein RSOLAG22IIIB_05258 [Rhizoctonia solani]|uniref:Protein kinase domain-containing protein n=1 Tax=Rhizoctonia solani TaxID=456999 RepID=A0A0K6G463_9AGAM|nr:hypothetical protein RSOLAG22IIIB_05258 [Rhizoctonia solani]
MDHSSSKSNSLQPLKFASTFAQESGQLANKDGLDGHSNSTFSRPPRGVNVAIAYSPDSIEVIDELAQTPHWNQSGDTTLRHDTAGTPSLLSSSPPGLCAMCGTPSPGTFSGPPTPRYEDGSHHSPEPGPSSRQVKFHPYARPLNSRLRGSVLKAGGAPVGKSHHNVAAIVNHDRFDVHNDNPAISQEVNTDHEKRRSSQRVGRLTSTDSLATSTLSRITLQRHSSQAQKYEPEMRQEITQEYSNEDSGSAVKITGDYARAQLTSRSLYDPSNLTTDPVQTETVEEMSQYECWPGSLSYQSEQCTKKVIGHKMPLTTIIEHLVNGGCDDVTSQLTSIDEYPRYCGGLSDVYRAGWPDGTPVAVKCLRTLSNTAIPNGKILKNTARELYMWSRASHPNVHKLHGLAVVRNKLAMVASWMEHGSLLAYIGVWPQVDRCNLCAQIASGLVYMHDLGLVHGDIKGNNVVVSEDGIAKITDFGSSTMAREFTIAFTETQSVHYSIRWAAPELFESKPACDRTDVYAYAKTVLEALTGDLPHKGLTDFAVMRSVGVEGKLPDRPLEYIPPRSEKGDELWSLLSHCWNSDPARRPSIFEVLTFMDDLCQGDLMSSS